MLVFCPILTWLLPLCSDTSNFERPSLTNPLIPLLTFFIFFIPVLTAVLFLIKSQSVKCNVTRCITLTFIHCYCNASNKKCLNLFVNEFLFHLMVKLFFSQYFVRGIWLISSFFSDLVACSVNIPTEYISYKNGTFKSKSVYYI